MNAEKMQVEGSLGRVGKSESAKNSPQKNSSRPKHLCRKLRRLSQKILRKESSATQAKLHEILSCGSGVAFGATAVSVNLAETHAFFRGVRSCHSVWSCPVCSPRILAARSEEMDALFKKAYSSGHVVALVTFTAHHTHRQSLENLIKTFKGAVRYFNANRRGKKFFAELQMIGKVQAYEVTEGYNGWHFHMHALWVVPRASLSLLSESEPELKSYWLHCYKQAGGEVPENRTTAFLKRGFVVSRYTDGKRKGQIFECHSGKYLCGWGGDKELTGLSTKKAKNGNRTPFELLESGKPKDAKLWTEFCLATKGKRRIIYSRGLKAWAGIVSVSDPARDGAADEEEKDSTPVCFWSLSDWKKLVEIDQKQDIAVLDNILDVAFRAGVEGGFAAVYNYCLETEIDYILPLPSASHPADEIKLRRKQESELLGGAGCIFPAAKTFL